MSGLMQKLRQSARKRSEFNSTYWELRSMPRETALDLGLFPEDAYKTAYKAVYKN